MEDRVLVELAPKGKALLAAIDAGLCPEERDGSIDISKFETFWAKFEKKVNFNSGYTFRLPWWVWVPQTIISIVALVIVLGTLK